MSGNYIENFRKELIQFGAKGDVNPLAKFQSSERESKYPGMNLHYNFSTISMANNEGIGKDSARQNHKDIYVEIDSNGNFTQLNYVSESRTYCDTMRRRFAAAEREGKYLIPIDTKSFLNRRFATKVNS